MSSLAVIGALFAFPSAQADPAPTVKSIRASLHKLEAMSEQVNQIGVRTKQTQNEIDDLSDDITASLATYNVQREELGSAIAQQQMDAPLGPTVSLFGSGDPDRFLAGLGAVQALNSTRADALEQFGESSRALKNRRAQLEDRLADLKKDKKASDKTRQEIRAKYDKIKAQIAQLSPEDQMALDGTIDLDFEPVASGRAQKAINFALAQLGEPYSWGGTGPGSWDCSGLVMKAWAAAGISIPRVVGPQYAAIRHISASQLQPGDLVFYSSMSHVGMYLGKGRVIHAPRPGRNVEITGLGSFSKYGRVG
ncbi:NlpC/P60 family protein [Aeromicrobium panaciterrae]|uniref:C40 family peptidase n=1 Tax=Aeromicrobium panaciterrae TaxID=363861 RepID=UPI0031CFB659